MHTDTQHSSPSLLDTILNYIDPKAPHDITPYNDALACMRNETDPTDPTTIDTTNAHRLQGLIAQAMRTAYDKRDYEFMDNLLDLSKRTLFYTAPRNFDDFLQAIEFDAPPHKKFYRPRRHYLAPMVQGYQDILDGKLRLLTVSMPKRSGKALSLDTPIPIPTAPYMKRMGDISVNDIVIGADGKPTRVTGVYPQPTPPEMYEVKFTDGASITACGDHLWEVKEHNPNAPKTKPAYTTKVMSTREMLESGVKHTTTSPSTNSSNRPSSHNRYAIKYTQPVEYATQPVLIDPYVLGVILGDGSLSQGAVSITIVDDEIEEYVSTHLPPTDTLKKTNTKDPKKGLFRIVKADRSKHNHAKSNTQEALIHYDLMGKRSYEKHIPEQYLYNDTHTRWELLRGLLDTDGYAQKNSIEYSTTSPHLKEQVVQLVRSLGGRATCRERMGRYTTRTASTVTPTTTSRIETRINYRVHISFPSSAKPFRLSRKADRYAPKREVLYHYIDSITPMGRMEAQCITVDNADHLFLAGDYFIPTHNSTTELLFCLMLAGLHPDKSILMEGTGDGLVRSFYNGLLEYLVQPTEYHFYEIFPKSILVQTNAESLMLNLNNKTRFPSLMCRSIDARQVGLSEANSLLVLDDCVEGREEAKNRARLDQKWEIISGDVMGRALEGTPIVATGTRYSLYDPIGRIQDHARQHGWEWRAIEIPALDPVTDESNYEFTDNDGKKYFTTEFFREQRELLSEEQWESEFQQQPFEAKGLLFPASSLNYYFQLPVDRDPDAVIAICDTAESGIDSTALGIFKIYGQDVFLDDIVFDSSPPEVTKPQCAKKIVAHRASTGIFESNNAGTYFARDVEEEVRALGGDCSIRTKRTISNKQTRIEYASDGIIKHFYFKDPSTYSRESQYATFMKELVTYTRSGKVRHDDAPDMLSLAENELRNLGGNKVEIFQRLW